MTTRKKIFNIVRKFYGEEGESICVKKGSIYYISSIYKTRLYKVTATTKRGVTNEYITFLVKEKKEKTYLMLFNLLKGTACQIFADAEESSPIYLKKLEKIDVSKKQVLFYYGPMLGIWKEVSC